MLKASKKYFLDPGLIFILNIRLLRRETHEKLALETLNGLLSQIWQVNDNAMLLPFNYQICTNTYLPLFLDLFFENVPESDVIWG